MATQPSSTAVASIENAVVSGGALDIIARGEYDVQIATAHKYPRNVTKFRETALALATLSEAIAAQCNYSLPRKDRNGQIKTIEGASIRFAEIIGSAWGNAHVGTRVISDDGEFITAQAVFHDLENNWRVVEEVQRRVTDSRGRRYSTDMVATTANAARSIAMRNAILHGIPRPLWEEIATRARYVAVGDVRSLATKRLEALKSFAVYGVTEAQVLGVLGRAGLDDVTIEDLGTLFGILTAIRDGDVTPEDAFAGEVAGATKTEALANSIRGRVAPPDSAPLAPGGAGTPAPAPVADDKSAKATRAPTYTEITEMINGGVADDACHIGIERVRDAVQRKELRHMLAARQQSKVEGGDDDDSAAGTGTA